MMVKNTTILCSSYKGELPLINALKNIIESEFKQIFLAVVIHGSVATDEIIPYSDFDGLLIVRDKYKNSKLLKKFIKKSLKQIYQFDPLQHHGWFILFENQLENYPQTYFPHVLFDYSKCIFPSEVCSFEIQFSDAQKFDYSSSFFKLANIVKIKSVTGTQHYNTYILKGFLSQFMLLPALYYQAHYRKGIFKKDSFKFARKDFSENDWGIMNEVSEIRKQWDYTLNDFQRYMLAQTNPIIRRYRKYFAPKTPNFIRQRFTPQFYDRIRHLSTRMIDNNDSLSSI